MFSPSEKLRLMGYTAPGDSGFRPLKPVIVSRFVAVNDTPIFESPHLLTTSCGRL